MDSKRRQLTASTAFRPLPPQHGFYAATICVPKKRLYAAVKELQGLGGSGVLVQPMTYIFDEEPQRCVTPS